ncbi:MAG: type II toxin-antitoxin system VapC family toxin [Phycisphaerae bacterium]|nr:type II toxin-antitoxin system VapC family toxin [Phycisphaerae bacterium]
MKPTVVDASVIAAAFFQERHGTAARSVLVAGEELNAPDLIHAEVANVIWKRHARKEIDAQEAADLLADLMRLPLRITPSDALIQPALQLALRTGRTVYDCLYLALAIRIKGVMITCDKRLVNALSRGPLDAYVTWIGQ